MAFSEKKGDERKGTRKARLFFNHFILRPNKSSSNTRYSATTMNMPMLMFVYRSSWSRDLASEATAPSEVVSTAASWAMERMKITCCLGPLVPVPFSVPRYTYEELESKEGDVTSGDEEDQAQKKRTTELRKMEVCRIEKRLR